MRTTAAVDGVDALEKYDCSLKELPKEVEAAWAPVSAEAKRERQQRDFVGKAEKKTSERAEEKTTKIDPFDAVLSECGSFLLC